MARARGHGQTRTVSDVRAEFRKRCLAKGIWSRRRGSNPHGTKYHWILSPARLPVPPLRAFFYQHNTRITAAQPPRPKLRCRSGALAPAMLGNPPVASSPRSHSCSEIPTGDTKRGARVASQAPLYYFNVNRTSLDHLLLGVDADPNKCVE